MAEPISIREFARREGVPDTLVHFALKEGRLSKLPSGKMDAALVGSSWRASARPVSPDANPVPPTGEAWGVTYGEALRLKENWLALLRRLDYEQRSGALVEIAVAQRVVSELCREQRDAWPAKVAPFLAVEYGIADLERLTASLALHVHTQLADLGEPDARFDARDS